jgi:exodeoxyribonuclease-5
VNDVTWSPQQAEALDAVWRWLRDPDGQQVFRLFGYAGTGKTTLAQEVAEMVDGNVCFAAYTGKAARVLHNKGCKGASTIHSLIYDPIEVVDKDTGKVRLEWALKAKSLDDFHNPRRPYPRPTTISALAGARLAIIDECSMVNEELGEDLLSFDTPVLVLGDPFQLPPVRGEGFFMGEPDVMLTEIHRQAADNPIIRMSMDVRGDRGLRPGRYGDSLVVPRRELSDERMSGLMLGADQVLCGMNAMRRKSNAYIRQRRGIDDPMPVAGERLVCLKNDRRKGLLNGGFWTVRRAAAAEKWVELTIDSLDDAAIRGVEVCTPEEFFLGTERTLGRYERGDEFTYGYVLTVHKSQGSEWDDVLLRDQSRFFSRFQPGWDHRRHLYTGITRASRRVTVVL